MKANNPKLNDALKNAEQYINQLKAMDDKKLSKYIDLFREQQQMALAQGKIEAYDLLSEYERQTIVARVEKL
jgi:hypothetical protein